MASSSADHNNKYDVFISFRGSDIRQGFLSYLHKALLGKNIEAFVDEQLERGKEISVSLLEKIKESDIALVIFSQNYAYSEWCLQELLKIAECRNTAGQIVIPVFYGVDPSHVQDLTGTYGVAMAQHRTQCDESMVDSWEIVLKEIASLSGLVSSNFKNESNLIDEIIQQTLDKLDCLLPSDSSCECELVGIKSRVENVMSLLFCSEDAHIVGIWGEGGIGKTTLARETFEQISPQFDSQCFVGNVREKSEKFTSDTIHNEVAFVLFGTSSSNMSWKKRSRKKVILVLDNVSDLDQIKSFRRYKDHFGFGSRIIITSRDSHLLKNLGAKIYAVEKLDYHESLQLFCLNAFHKKVPEEGYLELSKKAVEYAQGLPLALKVLGSNLLERSPEEWEDELEKLKNTSDQKILEIMRISYDGLPDVEKEIFLDIACVLNWRRRDEVESLLDVRGSIIGINRLAEKALISVSSKNQINMHDLIQQIAKDIICEEKTLEKRKWLWDHEEIYFLLTRGMGTESVRGISLDISKIKNINLSPTAFSKLYNLRYLHIYSSKRDKKGHLCLPQGLENLPEQLRYLRWDQYPSKSLPSINFLAEKLVELDMSDSQLEEPWTGVPDLPNLKRVSLFGCTKLIKVPDLSRASNLELLVLNYCSRLESLPTGICNLKGLLGLYVSNCGNLRELPQNLGNLESLEVLEAESSGLKELPESLCNLKKLKKLDVWKCANLNRLPQYLGNLKSLEDLWASGLNAPTDSTCYPRSCTALSVSSDFYIWNLESLQNLYVVSSDIKEVPDSINNMRGLKEISFYGCKGLILPPLTGDFRHLRRIDLTNCGISEFPIGICSITSLTCLRFPGNNFESIPESIQHLSDLEILDLSRCKKLKCLPESIKLLRLGRFLGLRECISLDQNQCSKIMNHLITEHVEGRKDDNKSIVYPGSEVPEKMKHKNALGSLLCFSFQLLELLDCHGLVFYASVVLDRTMYNVKCKGNFMDDSGLSFVVEANMAVRDDELIRSEHMLVQTIRLRSKSFVKGKKYRAEIQFLCLTTKPEAEYIGDLWSRDGIIKCGVFPLFHHH